MYRDDLTCVPVTDRPNNSLHSTIIKITENVRTALADLESIRSFLYGDMPPSNDPKTQSPKCVMDELLMLNEDSLELKYFAGKLVAMITEENRDYVK